MKRWPLMYMFLCYNCLWRSFQLQTHNFQKWLACSFHFQAIKKTTMIFQWDVFERKIKCFSSLLMWESKLLSCLVKEKSHLSGEFSLFMSWQTHQFLQKQNHATLKLSNFFPDHNCCKMADLRLRISIIEKNEKGQEVELVRKVIQFKPQVSHFYYFLLGKLKFTSHLLF